MDVNSFIFLLNSRPNDQHHITSNISKFVLNSMTFQLRMTSPQDIDVVEITRQAKLNLQKFRLLYDNGYSEVVSFECFTITCHDVITHVTIKPCLLEADGG